MIVLLLDESPSPSLAELHWLGDPFYEIVSREV